MLSLLRDARFAPLFWTQASGAFNDNLVKAAALLSIVTVLPPERSAVLVTLGTGIFILPFFLFSSVAGALADGLPKARVARAAKLAEIPIVVLGGVAFYLSSPALLLLTLFCLGSQSAFFGPTKYSIPPELLARSELVPANALLEASTFLAILLGTILGSLLILGTHGPLTIGALSLVVAVAGWWCSRRILERPASRPLDSEWWHVAKGTWHLMRIAAGRAIVLERDREPSLAGGKRMARIIAGIAWIWSVAAVYLALFPPLVANSLRTDERLVSVLLGAFALGVGVGSLLAQRLTRGRIDLSSLPFTALVMGLFSLDFALAAWSLAAEPTPNLSLSAWLAEPGSWRLLVDAFGLAAAGGAFVVPLYATLQARADQEVRARMIAALNVATAFWMVTASLAVSGFFALDGAMGGAFAGLTGDIIITVLLWAAAINLLGAVLVWRRLVPGEEALGTDERKLKAHGRSRQSR